MPMPRANRSRSVVTRNPTAKDVLCVIDRAYDMEVDDAAWVEGIAEAVRPLVDSGGGVHAFRFDLESGERTDPAFAGGSPEWSERWRSVWWDGFMRQVPAEGLRAMVQFGPVTHTTDLWAATARKIATFEQLLTRGGRGTLRDVGAAAAGLPYPDSLNVAAVDASGVGVALCADRSAIAPGPPSPRTRVFLGRLAGHLAAAARLRVRLGPGPLIERADAVFSPTGTVVHASESTRIRVTRDALRTAARDVVRARDQRGQTPTAALEHWRALFAGEYSVLDVFDTDGRRFVVAKSNVPSAPRLPARQPLTEREAQVVSLVAAGCANKLVAYELGISPTTAASHLRSAARKLGVRTTADVVRLARERRAPE